MIKCFEFHQGSGPLLISVPHDGRELPDDVAHRMTPVGRSLPDTDWHVVKLYGFAEALGASVISANFSRYVVDLNRAADDGPLYENRPSTGLCPLQTFAGEPIYGQGGEPDADEIQHRVHTYWQPYHGKLVTTLERLRERHGYALLWDAHSIQSRVPGLFEGRLPDLNIGTNNGSSCDARLQAAVADVARQSDYSSVVNGRFRGGFITRHLGCPDVGVHAIQLELSQRRYMDEATGRYDDAAADALRATITGMLEAFMERAR